MRREMTILILILLFQKAFCQDNIPKLVPLSPEAAQFTNFSEMPKSSFVGMADVSIPIYVIKIDGFEVPISLKYIGGSGIKVDETASRVGLGWYLDIGAGAITKNVVGRPDIVREKIKTDSNVYDVHNIDCGNNQSRDKDIFKSLTTSDGNDSFFPPGTIEYPGLDLQPDIYSYETISGQGKFIFDYQNNIQLIPKSGIRILSTNPNVVTAFKILDINGIEYLFQSRNFTNYFDGTHDQAISTMFKPSYLKTPSGKMISFKYDKNVNFEDYGLNSSSYDEMTLNGVCQSGYSGSGKLNKFSESLLTEINFDNGKILIDYDNREDVNEDVYVKSFKVLNINNVVVKNIIFDYDYFIGKIGTALISQNVGGSVFKKLKLNYIYDTISTEKYSFTYYNEEKMPVKYSAGIDHWGLSNGKTYNENRINAFVGKLQGLGNSLFYRFSDREADKDFGKAGLLKSIIYPTGGYTEYVYEPDDYYYNKAYVTYDQPHNLDGSLIDDNGDTFEVDTLETLDFEMPFSTPSNSFDFRGSFYSSHIEQNGGNNGGHGIDGECKAKILDSNNNLILNLILNSEDARFNLLAGKNYKIVLNNSKGQETPNRCYLNINYRLSETKNVKNKQVGTFRIAEIKKHDSDGLAVLSKQYIYRGANDKSTGVMMDPPLLYKTPNIRFKKVGNNARTCYYDSYSSTSFGGVGTNSGKSVGYTMVKEVLLDLKDSNNNISKQYYYDPNIDEKDTIGHVFQIPVPASTMNYKKGLLRKEIEYNYNSRVREKEYLYDYDDYFNSFSADKIGSNEWGSTAISYGLVPYKNNVAECVLGSQIFYDATYDYYIYPIYSSWVKNVKTTTTDYVNNVPTLVTEQTTSYSPTPPNHTFPIKQKSEVIGSNNINIHEFKYAQDKAGYTRLIDANMVGIPLVTEIRKNNILVSKTETKYDNPSLLLPTSVLTYNLDDIVSTEITYNQYDTKGNLEQYTTKDGVSIVIIWGYNKTQPIAKIEGASYDQIQGIANIVSASNTDAMANINNDETEFLTTLDQFRNSNMAYQITTYTYDPLVGVRSITPPSGVREFYYYDTANRLQYVKDVNGNILKEYEYKYKQ